MDEINSMTKASQGEYKERTGARDTAEQYDQEFRNYTTKYGGKAAQAIAMARAELSKCNGILFQDKKLEENGVKKGRLTPEQREHYEKRVEELSQAIEQFHLSIATSNKTKAIVSASFLIIFLVATYLVFFS